MFEISILSFLKVAVLYIYAYLLVCIDLFCIFIQDIWVKKPDLGLLKSMISDEVS